MGARSRDRTGVRRGSTAFRWRGRWCGWCRLAYSAVSGRSQQLGQAVPDLTTFLALHIRQALQRRWLAHRRELGIVGPEPQIVGAALSLFGRERREAPGLGVHHDCELMARALAAFR